MATYRTDKTQPYSKVIGHGYAGTVKVAATSIALTTAMIDNANDDVELFWVPAGAVICDVQVRLTDVDDGTALVIDVGDATVEDRLVAAATTGQAAGRTETLAAAGFLYKYTTATRLKLFIKTAAGTPAAGTLTVAVYFFIDENFTAAATVTGTV